MNCNCVLNIYFWDTKVAEGTENSKAFDITHHLFFTLKDPYSVLHTLNGRKQGNSSGCMSLYALYKTGCDRLAMEKTVKTTVILYVAFMFYYNQGIVVQFKILFRHFPRCAEEHVCFRMVFGVGSNFKVLRMLKDVKCVKNCS